MLRAEDNVTEIHKRYSTAKPHRPPFRMDAWTPLFKSTNQYSFHFHRFQMPQQSFQSSPASHLETAEDSSIQRSTSTRANLSSVVTGLVDPPQVLKRLLIWKLRWIHQSSGQPFNVNLVRRLMRLRLTQLTKPAQL